MAMLRRSLREISRSAMQQRKQQQQLQQRPNLNLDHFSRADVSETSERHMLAYFKAENEMEDEESGSTVGKLPNLQPAHIHPTVATRQQAKVSAGRAWRELRRLLLGGFSSSDSATRAPCAPRRVSRRTNCIRTCISGCTSRMRALKARR